MTQRVATAPASTWNYSMADRPPGHKCLLLTTLGIAVIGSADSDPGYMAWAPLPKRDEALEIRLGLRADPRQTFIAGYIDRCHAAGLDVTPTEDEGIYADDGVRMVAEPCACGCPEGWAMRWREAASHD